MELKLDKKSEEFVNEIFDNKYVNKEILKKAMVKAGYAALGEIMVGAVAPAMIDGVSKLFGAIRSKGKKANDQGEIETVQAEVTE